MNRILFTILVFGLLALNGLRAQNEEYWEEVPRPYGGRAWDVVATSNGRLYAQMNWGDIYRSDDEGTTWTALDSLNYTIFSDYYDFYIGKAGTVFAKKSSIWHRSTNDGVSWQALGPAPISTPPFTAPLEKIVESANGILTGFAKGHFFYSEDHGGTWLEAIAPGPIPYTDANIKLLQHGEILVSPPFYFQADSSYTFFRSSDEGQSWHEHVLTFPISFGEELSFSPSGAAFLFGGETILRAPGSGMPFEVAYCDSLPIYTKPFVQYSNDLLALPSGRLLKTESRNMLYSDDDGLTWHELPDYSHQGANHGNTYLFPNAILPDGKILINRGSSGIYASNDMGKTWNFASNNIRCSIVLEMHFETDSSFYAVTSNGLWKTQNKGLDWLHLFDPLYEYYPYYTGDAPLPFLHFDKPGALLLGAFDKVLLSTNGGEAFNNIKPADLDNASYEYWHPYIHPETKDLYISGRRSLDTGATWQYSDHPTYFLKTPLGTLLGLKYSPNSTYLSKSEDNGETWTNQNTIPFVKWASQMKIAPDGTLYIIGDDNINQSSILLKSEDSGETWTSHAIPGIIPSPTSWASFYILEITNLGHLVLSTRAHTYLSVNKGLSWQNIPDSPVGFYPGLGQILNTALSPDQYLYLSHESTGLYKTRKPISSGSYLHGHVLLDADADCSTEDATAPLKNWIVEATGAGSLTYTNTDSLGAYVMLLDTGSYQVGVKISNGIWWGLCDSVQAFQADSLFSNDTLNFSALSTSDCPLISVDVSTPILRRCFSNTIYVQYCNIGSEPADSAWIDIFLDPYLSLLSCQLPYNALGNNVFRVEIGDVPFGDCGQFTFEAYINCDSTIIGQTHCISVHGFPDTLCTILPNWSGANLEAEAHCQDSIIELVLRNTGTATSQTLEYVIIEDDVVLFTGQESYDPAEVKLLSFAANGHTWRIESEQEPGHPFSVKAIAFAEGCGGFESLGFINQFSVNGFRPSIDRVCLENIGSYDPNDKQGFPLGIGDDHDIRPGQELEYMIRFQNTGTDTAFTVLIRDTLSTLLDPASIRPGAASHPFTWELSGNGIVTFSFQNIELPDSNTNLAGSQGFLSFRINQKEALALGSVIYNSAGIYFDFNAPVITNQTWHTLSLPIVSSISSDLPNRPFNPNISPNPTSDVLFLDSQTAPIHRVEVSSAEGTLQKTTDFGNPMQQVQIRLEELPTGTYFARVFCGNGVVVKKFVVAR